MSNLVRNVIGSLLAVLLFVMAMSISDHTESRLAEKRFESHVVTSNAYVRK